MRSTGRNQCSPRLLKSIVKSLLFRLVLSVPIKVTSILDQARDWKVICDLRSERRSFSFPGMIAITTAEPDLVVYSLKKKICIIWELTAPMEENIEKRHKEKIDKYERSIGHNLSKGWSLHIVAGEVDGCRRHSRRISAVCSDSPRLQGEKLRTNVQRQLATVAFSFSRTATIVTLNVF